MNFKDVRINHQSWKRLRKIFLVYPRFLSSRLQLPPPEIKLFILKCLKGISYSAGVFLSQPCETMVLSIDVSFIVIWSYSILNIIPDSLSNAHSPMPSPTSLHSPSNNHNIANGPVAIRPLPSSLSYHNSRPNSVQKYDDDGSLAKGEVIRDRAKIAVQQLYDRNISFNEIVSENIDATFLKELFLEIGLAVPASPRSQQIDTSKGITQPVSTRRYSPLDNSDLLTSTPNFSAIEPPTFSSQLDERRMFESKDSTSGVNSNRLSTTKSDGLPELSVEPNAAKAKTTKGTSPSPQLAAASISKKPSFIPSADKIDRKEYIAKMLAAKTGKSITAAKISKPAETPITQAEIKEPPIASTVITEKTAIPIPPPIEASLDKENELENKRKAQTELARRRIDALNSRIISPSKPSNEFASVDSHSVISGISPKTQPRDQELLSIKGVPSPLQLQPLQHNVQNSAPQSQHTPSSSFFSSLGWRPPSGLPGLFPFSGLFPASPDLKEPEITSTVTEMGQISSQSDVPSRKADPIQPESGQISSNEEGMIIDPIDSPIPTDHSDLDEATSRELEQSAEELQKEQDTIDVKDNLERAAPATQLQNELENQYKSDEAVRKETEAEVLSFAPSSPHLSTPSREQIRKRPIASDFIENTSVRAKRRMDSSNHPQVLIELSEEEDDSEDDKMDLDDAHNLARRMPNTSQYSESIRPKTIRDLPQLSDFTSRARGGISSAMNTPPLVQTPGKALEQEMLKQKEEQILLMQRKIAEMEQRRRAKQSMSRAQTPAFSGTPIPESVPAIAEAKADDDSSMDQSVKATVEQVEAQQHLEQFAVQRFEAQEATALAAGIEMREKLEAEEHAKAAAKKNSEETARIEAARFMRAAEMQIRMERKTALQNALLELDQLMERIRKKLENRKIEIAELEAELQKGADGRRSAMEELEDIAKAEAEDQTDAIPVPLQHDDPAIKTADTTEPGKCSLWNRVRLRWLLFCITIP